MEKTLTLETDDPDTAELRAAIAQCLTRMSELRENMRRADTAIEDARKETLANLADIDEVLVSLKAA